MQNILAMIVGLMAFIYVIKIIIKQFWQVEVNPKCEDCPVPEIMNQKRYN